MEKNPPQKLLIALMIISFIFFLILSLHTQTQWAQDSHWHMSLAKSFAEGNGYAFDGTDFPHGKYPPGITLLILPFQLILNNTQFAGLMMAGLITLASIFLIYKIGSISDKKIGLLAATFLVFHNLFIFNSVSIMTELPFMFFSLASIYFFVGGFEKEKLFLPSAICFSLASLIRYDGFFLVPVFLIYTYTQRKKLKDLDLNYVLLGILSVAILLGGWFLRNWIVFGNPLSSAYTSEVDTFNIMKYVKFLFLFFKLGYLFSGLALVGLYFFIKENNKKLRPYLIWLVFYLGLHMYWSHRVLRFYVEVLGIFCILAAYGVFGLAYKLKLNRKKTIAFISIILVLFISCQSALFFIWPQGESGLVTISRYNPIKEISEYANNNLPEDAIYGISDYAVYNLYLDRPNLFYYEDTIRLFTQNKTAYLLTDTFHPWYTQPFLMGENGSIKLRLEDNRILTVETEKIFESNGKRYRAFILKLNGLSIE